MESDSEFDESFEISINPLLFFASNPIVIKTLPDIIARLDTELSNALKKEILDAKEQLEMDRSDFERQKAEFEFRLQEFHAKEEQCNNKQKELEQEREELGCKICFDTTFKNGKFLVATCGHILCDTCKPIVGQRCPFCQKKLNSRSFKPIFF